MPHFGKMILQSAIVDSSECCEWRGKTILEHYSNTVYNNAEMGSFYPKARATLCRSQALLLQYVQPITHLQIKLVQVR